MHDWRFHRAGTLEAEVAFCNRDVRMPYNDQAANR
jgi:hypothetical protein